MGFLAANVDLVVVCTLAFAVRALTKMVSLAHWSLRGLHYYPHPTMTDLRAIAAKETKAPKALPSSEFQDFTLARSARIPLEVSAISKGSLLGLPFYAHLEEILFFTAGCLVSLAVSEVLCVVRGEEPTQHHFVLLWCTLSVSWTIKRLFERTLLYRGEEFGISVYTGTTLFMLSMAVLLSGSDGFDFHFEKAYKDAEVRVANNADWLPSVARLPALSTCRALAALLCAPLAVMLAYCAVRLGRCYSQAQSTQHSILARFLLLSDAVMSLLVAAAWLPAFGRSAFIPLYLSVEEYKEWSLFFDNVRLWLLAFACLARLACLRVYMRSFLASAEDRLLRLMGERGLEKKSRVSANMVQQAVGNVFIFTCGAAVQLLAPVALTIAALVVFKTQGGMGFYMHQSPVPAPARDDFLIFSPLFYRELCGFACWWIWTATAGIAVVSSVYRRLSYGRWS